MFTGIVEATGDVLKIEGGGGDRRMWIRSNALVGREVGASVAVDGTCLTVVDRDDDVCVFDVSAESLARTTLGARQTGDVVNVETPLRAGDELGGHIVQGHVDGVGRIRSVTDDGEGRRVRVEIDPTLMRYLVEKGSVTVDGVSLTITAMDDRSFEVALVPHTLSVTTLGRVEAGREVNIEVDVLAKYIERMAAPWRAVRDDPETVG